MTFKGFVGGKTNEFKIEDNIGTGNLSYKVAPAPRFGAGFAYKWFSASSSLFKLGEPDETDKGATEQLDFQWNFYLRFLTIDFRIQRYKGYFLQNSNAIENWESINNNLYQRTDLVTGSFGGNIRYNLNFRKYSPKAMFSQTERQLKSAGSMSLGLRFNALGVQADSTLVPTNLQNDLNTFNLNQLSFVDLGLGIGYGYTFVRGKWFFNIGAMAFIVNQNLSFVGDNIQEEQSSAQVNVQSRSALGFSNDNFYIGFTVLADQMYSNWQNDKDFIYTFSKTKFVLAKRIHTKPIKNISKDIWDQI